MPIRIIFIMSMQLTTESPQKITLEADDLTEDQLAILTPQLVEEQLRIQYAIYRQNSNAESLIKKIERTLYKVTARTIGFLHQFWREIIPEVIRGPMPAFASQASSGSEQKQRQLFQEFLKKRTPFFLIVLKSDCSEEEIQQAYLSATDIVPQGLSIRYEELQSSTSYRHWNIKNANSFEKYRIHVLKFDVFQKMIWFGSLTCRQLVANSEATEYLEHFKRNLDSVIKQYQRIEDSFLGSYVEKEDRSVLDSLQEK